MHEGRPVERVVPEEEARAKEVRGEEEARWGSKEEVRGVVPGEAGGEEERGDDEEEDVTAGPGAVDLRARRRA